MSRFIIPVKDQFGNTVYFQTSPHKGQQSVDGYASVIMWLEKNGFKVATKVLEGPKAAPEPATSGEMHCHTCGLAMTLREGTSKTGKPWKGWFCPSPDKHEVVWVK